jgi:hypothetical protein
MSILMDVSFYTWNTLTDDSHMHTTINTLDPTLPHDDTCYHDMGANCHVFHDHYAFKTYELTDPIIVCGFGHNLSTVMVG